MKKKKFSFTLDLSNKKVRRVFIIAVATILVLIAAVGTTLAFIATKTEGVQNIFDPVTITCEVLDGTSDPQDAYKVKNTGEYDAYIRAYFVVHWVDSNGNVYGQPPVKGTDYTLNVTALDVNNNAEADKWELGDDGFYYYTTPVAPQAATLLALLTDVTLEGTAPEGYELQVQMIAEAIQADPISTVEDYWGVDNPSGEIITK